MAEHDDVVRAVREAFDERAPEYDDSEMHRRLAEAVAEFTAVDAGTSVVDIATGTGLVLRALAARAADLDLVGVDISPGMLAVARAALPEARWIEADVTHVPVESASADLITCVTALHIFPDPAAAVREWRRMLRPGGRVVTATFAQAGGDHNPHGGVSAPPSSYPRDHASFATRDALAVALAPAGLAPVRSTTWEHHGDVVLIVESTVAR